MASSTADTLPTGSTSYASEISDTPDIVAFTERYGYVSVANLGTDPLYITTRYTAADTDHVPVVPADETPQVNVFAVQPDETQVFANQLPLWYQSSKVLVPGDDNANGQSNAGQLANPGTVVKLTGSASSAYVVAAAG